MKTQGAYDTMQKFTKAKTGYGFAVFVNKMGTVQLQHLTLARYDTLVNDLNSKYGYIRKEFVGLYNKKVKLKDLQADVDFVVEAHQNYQKDYNHDYT